MFTVIITMFFENVEPLTFSFVFPCIFKRTHRSPFGCYSKALLKWNDLTIHFKWSFSWHSKPPSSLTAPMSYCQRWHVEKHLVVPISAHHPLWEEIHHFQWAPQWIHSFKPPLGSRGQCIILLRIPNFLVDSLLCFLLWLL